MAATPTYQKLSGRGSPLHPFHPTPQAEYKARSVDSRTVFVITVPTPDGKYAPTTRFFCHMYFPLKVLHESPLMGHI